jgi:hypothetical protein
MQSRLRYMLVSLVFYGTLVAIAIANHFAGIGGMAMQDSGAALKRYGFYLQEVSRQSGIDFTHQKPVLDAKLSRIMPEIAAMGASVSVCDFNHDGLPDIYVCNSAVGSKNHLYENLGNGKFVDVADKLGIADVNRAGAGVSMGSIWGDYDNSGYESLLIYKWGGPPMLFHNNQGTSFTDVSKQAGLPQGIVNANSATWVDYDRDGHLDLLICGYYPENLDLWHLKNTRMMPNSFEYATNGGRKYLLRNRGNGTFEDVTKKMGIDSHRWTLACGAADLFRTGYPDLVLANDYGVTEVYQNHHGHGFTEVGKQLGIGYHPKSGMNVAFGDIYNDGRYSIYVSNISEEGQLIQHNNLWTPDSANGGPSLHYDNEAEDAGVDMGGWSFGAQFGDLNNAGALDIVLTNGFISAGSRNYWYDFGKIAGGYGSLIADANNWPPIQDMSLSGYQAKRVWINDGSGTFHDVAQAVGYTDLHDGRSLAMADFWNNGALDFAVSNQNGPLLLYKNTVDPANHWIEFQLEGTKSNRSAIGAELMLYWKNDKGQDLVQLQQVDGASGFCAQNDRRLHFGLGKNPVLEKAVIRWPIAGSTPQTLLNLTPDKLWQIKEPS